MIFLLIRNTALNRMKPNGGVEGGVSSGMKDGSGEVDIGELSVQLGLLVIESRVPASSVKGRQDGPHCPHSVGDWPSHSCDMRENLCVRAAQMQKQMLTLWRNHVPICIEVLLFPSCHHGHQKALIIDVPPPISTDDSYVLLEQWTIQGVAKKSTESCVSLKALFQAMRSYLHFSQLSAWLNLTHGSEPQCIGYRISPPAEFCTSTFNHTPEMHAFPLAIGNKCLNVRVSLSLLPRLADIPQPVCRGRHYSKPQNEASSPDVDSSFVDEVCDRFTDTAAVGGFSSTDRTAQDGACSCDNDKTGSNSASGLAVLRLDKPNILNSFSPQMIQTISRPSQQCENNSELNGSKMVAGDATTKPHIRERSEKPSLACVRKNLLLCDGGSDATSGEMRTHCANAAEQFSDEECSSTCGEYCYYSEVALECRTNRRKQSSIGSSAAKMSTIKTSPCLIQQNYRHSSVALSTVMRLQPSSSSSPRPLSSQSWQKETVDSDGSLPDFDSFLSKTLENRRDPLSPEEMEGHLRNVFFSRGTTAAAALSGVPRLRELSPNSSSSEVRIAYDSRMSKMTLTKTSRNGCAVTDNNSGIKCDIVEHIGGLESCASASNGRVIEQESCEPLKDRWMRVGGIDDVKDHSTVLSPNSSPSLDNDDFERPVFTVGRDLIKKDAVSQPHKNIDSRLPSDRESLVNVASSDTVEDDCDVRTELKSSSIIVSTPLSTNMIHKSISCPNKQEFKSSGASKVNSLLKTIMKKELVQQALSESKARSSAIPTEQERSVFKQNLNKSANVIFHAATGLPLQSSPVPAKRMPSGSFDYDISLNNNIRAIKNSLSCISLDKQSGTDNGSGQFNASRGRAYSTSAPASTNCLLGNFEESLINGRIEPSGVVDGFMVDIGASGSFCPRHIKLPVTAFFFSLSDDSAPSPYLGHIDLENHCKRGYHIPTQGTIQVTLFNPSKTVVKMFVVTYDMSDMPSNSQTFLRQRTLYMPVKGSASDTPESPVYLRYLIHLRFASSKSSKIYLHTDIRVIFARDKFELDSRVANYELRSFTEGPVNPKYSPKK